MMILIASAICLLVMAACVETALSTITIIADTGTAIGAKVTLVNNNGNKAQVYTQVAKGTAVDFKKVVPGSYTVTVELEGYMPFTNNDITVHSTVPEHTVNIYQRLVFYDKGSVSDGWRYLEVAPVSTEFRADWDTAIRKCKELNIGGYTNWRLPTDEELGLMYKNLKVEDLGGFQDEWYWSSSLYRNYANLMWYHSFYNGIRFGDTKSNSNRVRAIRAF